MKVPQCRLDLPWSVAMYMPTSLWREKEETHAHTGTQ